MISSPETFATEHWVPADRDRVFRFFADPRNLPVISPPSSGARLVQLQLTPPSGIDAAERLAGPGSVIEVSVRILPYFPLRARWTARILEFEYGNCFRDTQERGPFRRWLHTHSFREEPRDGRAGTLVRDSVEYEVGFGPFEALAGALFVRAMLRNMFAYRQRATERILS